MVERAMQLKPPFTLASIGKQPGLMRIYDAEDKAVGTVYREIVDASDFRDALDRGATKDAEIADLRRERDEARRKNAEWASAASFGDGSPMFTPKRLIASTETLMKSRDDAIARSAAIEEQNRALEALAGDCRIIILHQWRVWVADDEDALPRPNSPIGVMLARIARALALHGEA